MNNLFNEILINTDESITVNSSLIIMFVSLVLGGLIALTYRKTESRTSYQRNFAVTLFILPIILSVIVLFVGSNVARAFSLAGTLSIIRFRSAPGDVKDIGFIFFDIAAGLACGVGLYGYGMLFVIILCGVIIVVERFKLFKTKEIQKILKIMIPENLNYQGAFDDILNRYTKSFTLSKIKTTELGSLYEVEYDVSVDENINEYEFLNELRCRNGNLTIVLTMAPKIIK